MSVATKEQELESAVKFLAQEMRLVKKTVEQHTHHVEQLRRAVIAVNELLADVALQEEVDDLKLRLNEIQAKSHRKFPASGENKPASLDNME